MMTVRCSTLLSFRRLRDAKAFENLIAAKIFACVTPVPAGTTKEFVRYKCMVESEEVRGMVSAIGQTTLNQWYKRAQ
jgi:origin recognition complex subunit 4